MTNQGFVAVQSATVIKYGSLSFCHGSLVNGNLDG